MFKEYRKEIDWGGRPLVIETGKIARQADGAVMVTYGESKVLCAVVGEKKPKAHLDFFPLTVHYVEKAYAAGKIPGGFFKREGRPTEKETLVCRLIDRPIRPLFVKGFKNETQVICTVLSHDQENETDVPALIAASAALTISGLPFMGPLGACRVGYIDGEYVLNPQLDQMADSSLELMVAGTNEGVLMVESEASELSEDIMLGAVSFGHKAFQPVIDAIIDLAENCAKEPIDLPEPPAGLDELKAKVKGMAEAGLRDAYKATVKQTRQEKISAAKSKVVEDIASDDSVDQEFADAVLGDILKSVEKDIVRRDIIDTGMRIDGRDTKTVRQIAVEVGVLPRAHGSALFTRGETQALVTATLGTGQDEQIIDALEGEYREHFLLHYNFPPYSVGEVGRVGPPGRREVGHGKLAWRALQAVLPAATDFPYTIRVVSEITESNGSSSMASVCGGSLSMMDAGVPLKAPVAGVAMGLILEDDGDFAILTDILGDEDHLGDMDFKVAGTANGITALQMDIKITGLDRDLMKTALQQAKEGRLHILGEMNKALSTHRGEINQHAPRIVTLTVPKDKIRDVIGPGGKVIREIIDKTGVSIDINDDGLVSIASADAEAAAKAVEFVENLTQEVEVGKIYLGKVKKIVDFGAFVEIFPGTDGLVHISQICDRRIKSVSDEIQEGDEIKVKVIDVDQQGKVKLSRKEALKDAVEAAAPTAT